jgi:hypothetical protein
VASAPITAVAGVAITNAVVATYTVTDPSGQPGTQWRAHIDFGDGQSDRQLSPIPVANGFEFVDSHTYTTPGSYTVTVLIAVPGSHSPSDNTVTVPVTVTAPTPPPVPPSSIGNFAAIGVRIRAREGRTFHGNVALFRDPQARPQQFTATIAWGDQSPPTAARIRAVGRGKFVVMGTHRYLATGGFLASIVIRDTAREEIATQSSVNVIQR